MLGESGELYDVITYSSCVEMLIDHYEHQHLNVAKNLALYYKWMIGCIYGDKPNTSKLIFDLWLNVHREDLDQQVPQLQFGKKYYNSIIQYLISMGCYQ